MEIGRSEGGKQPNIESEVLSVPGSMKTKKMATQSGNRTKESDIKHIKTGNSTDENKHEQTLAWIDSQLVKYFGIFVLTE